MIPKPQEIQNHAFGIVDRDARLRFLANASSDAAHLAASLAGLVSLAAEAKIQEAITEKEQEDG